MNKITLLSITGLSFLFGIFDANAFNIVNNASLSVGAQCTGANVTVREYFNTPFQPRDEFTYSAFAQLQPVTSPTVTDPNQTSRIGIYNPSGNLNCGNMNNWIYPSIAVPANKTTPAINTVVSIAKGPSDLCRIVTLPATRNDIIAQFVFRNAYRDVASWLGAGTSWTVGVTLPVAPNVMLPLPTNYTITPDYILSNTVRFEQPECLNIQAAWCGDGVLDAGYEGCDSADPSRAGWGVGGCNASCQPIGGGGGGGGVCGNGVLEAGEQCDDGNTTAGDGCSALCTIEGGGGGGGTPPGGGGTPPSGGGPVTTPGSSSYCGDGIVERPNRDGQYETCDTVASWCVDCTVTSTTPGSTLPGDLTITTPGSSPVSILGYRLIIGDGVPVFSPNDIVSFRTNTPMYLQNKTATITNNSPLIEGVTVPKLINDQGVGGPILFEDHRTYDASGNLVNIVYNQRIYPNILPLFDGDELQSFRGKTDSFVNNPSIAYRDTSSSPVNGFYASLQYLTSPFHIRVSKPLIANTAGGNAFIAGPIGYSVDTVVHNFMNNLANGNFTTTTVNVDPSYALSSSTQSLAGNAPINTIIGSGSDREQSSIQKSSLTPSGLILPDVYIANLGELMSKSEKFADTETVRVFKNANVTIGGDVNLTGVRTIIIENGNLFINADITYADKDASFAWVVKNGNIIVRHDVENIAGVYVTLAGSIKSDGMAVPDRLSVDGSLYGDTSDLVANRSYVRGETGYTALNVGVVINYSNRALINPPPLLSRFLEQYTLQKVAK